MSLEVRAHPYLVDMYNTMEAFCADAPLYTLPYYMSLFLEAQQSGGTICMDALICNVLLLLSIAIVPLLSMLVHVYTRMTFSVHVCLWIVSAMCMVIAAIPEATFVIKNHKDACMQLSCHSWSLTIQIVSSQLMTEQPTHACPVIADQICFRPGRFLGF